MHEKGREKQTNSACPWGSVSDYREKGRKALQNPFNRNPYSGYYVCHRKKANLVVSAASWSSYRAHHSTAQLQLKTLHVERWKQRPREKKCGS